MAAPTRFETVRAFAVHVFTACGAALAFLALVLATGGHWAAMFFCLGLALVVDGADGPLAREFKVAEVLPRWSGETLDLIVDFTTYVFVPAYAIAASGMLPKALAVPAGIVVVITGALYFADRQMKTADNYFRGFPGLWNLAAFYLYLLEPPEWLAAGLIVALAVLTFLPLKFLHPLRVKRLRCAQHRAARGLGGAGLYRGDSRISCRGHMSCGRWLASRFIFSASGCCARPPDRAGFPVLNVRE